MHRASIVYNLDCLDSDRFYSTSGPSKGWAFGDAVMVGHSLSEAEYRSHFALWAVAKSPLIIGFDLRGRAKNDSSVVTVSNEDLIAINQDVLGTPARCVMGCTLAAEKVSCGEWWGGRLQVWPPSGRRTVQIWTGPLSGGSHVVIVVNRKETASSLSFDWLADARVPQGKYHLYDLWQHRTVANMSSPSRFAPTAELSSHAHLAFRLDRRG